MCGVVLRVCVHVRNRFDCGKKNRVGVVFGLFVCEATDVVVEGLC